MFGIKLDKMQKKKEKRKIISLIFYHRDSDDAIPIAKHVNLIFHNVILLFKYFLLFACIYIYIYI